MNKPNEKYLQYAALLSEKIADIFNEDNMDSIYINPEELEEGDNLTQFFHALANVVPSHMYNKITGDNKNHLEFNHVANMLVFQYSLQKPEAVDVDGDGNDE